jgi:creatinine amidohydrolase/Fe(II)-dependent formamide hydrolase-like protein
MDPLISHGGVTTIMRISERSRRTSVEFVCYWRRTMGKKSKLPKMTPEEHARRDETQRLVRERIAYHEAKAREEEAARERGKS